MIQFKLNELKAKGLGKSSKKKGQRSKRLLAPN